MTAQPTGPIDGAVTRHSNATIACPVLRRVAPGQWTPMRLERPFQSVVPPSLISPEDLPMPFGPHKHRPLGELSLMAPEYLRHLLTHERVDETMTGVLLYVLCAVPRL